MEEIFQALQGLQQKAAKLEREVTRLKAEKVAAEQRLSEMEEQLEAQKGSYQELQQHYEAARAVGSLGSVEDRDMMKAQIDLYLKEIDICLNNLGE